jgi:hypothetical protein
LFGSAWTVDPSKRWTYEPAQIQLIEKTVGADYRSLLGEWLGDSSFGYREYLEKQAGTPESIALKRIAIDPGQALLAGV